MAQKKEQALNEKVSQGQQAEKEQKKEEISPTWAEETIMDLDDFIESQGIYIRQ